MSDLAGDFLKEYEAINAEEIQALVKEVQEKGVSEKVKQSPDKWKDIPLNIAVTGVTGVGKSSFINAIRRLDADSPGAAEVGVKETTKKPTPFAHPDNEKVVFWDLPGVGSPNFPQAMYMDAVGFSKYDFFIIISSNRFQENDLWLANEIRSRNKKFYFARSKIDQEIDNDKADHPETHIEPALLEKMRSKCATNLLKLAKKLAEDKGRLNRNALESFANTPIFLISSRKPHLWDFPKLVETFITDIPGLKKEVMLYSINHNTEAIIKEKSKMLLSRAWKTALAKAAVAAGPVSGLSIAVDVGLLKKEISFYKETLGLDSLTLDRLSKASGVARSLFDLRLQTFMWVEINAQSVLQLFAPHVAEETVRFFPFIGSLIAGLLSFVSTKLKLETIIRDMEGCAIEIIGMTIQRTSDD